MKFSVSCTSGAAYQPAAGQQLQGKEYVSTPGPSDWLLQEAKCCTKVDFAQTSREVLIVETESCGSTVIERLMCDKQFSTYTVIRGGSDSSSAVKSSHKQF